MIDGAIRLLSAVLCLTVIAGFVMFAVDQGGGASERQQIEVVNPGMADTQQTPAPRPERTGLGGAIEDANEVLLKPLPVRSSNAWVAHGVPALLALALYGAGLGFLARWTRSRG